MAVVVRSVKLVSAIMAGYSHVAGTLREMQRQLRSCRSADHRGPLYCNGNGRPTCLCNSGPTPCSLSSIVPLKLGVADGSRHCNHVRDGVTLAGKVRCGYGLTHSLYCAGPSRKVAS
jgi:hypothetical protein